MIDEQKIRQRAYEIYRARQLAGAPGNASLDWQQAEVELWIEEQEQPYFDHNFHHKELRGRDAKKLGR